MNRINNARKGRKNTAGILLAIAIFLGCVDVPEDLRNEAECASSGGAGLHGQSSSSSSLRQSSSSGGEIPSELLCSAAPEAGAEGEAIIKPVVTCGGIAVSASSWAGSPHAPDWDSPKEGSYSGIVAIAACGGSSKMADCPGLLTVVPAKLACGAVPSTAVEGMPVTKPAVLCDGIAVPAESWQPASLSWSSPEEGVYSNIKATAKCGGISKTVACSGTLAVVPPGGVLACDAVPSTGAAGVSIAPPAVKCDGAAVSAAAVTWSSGAPAWGNPSANTYSGVKATASCGSASKTADCSGVLTVTQAQLTCDAVPSAGVAGMAIIPPAVKCDGAAVSAAAVTWSSGAPAWGNPSAGSYSGVKATASCGGTSKTADCGGTLTVSPNLLTCTWANKPASISQGQALAATQRPDIACSSGSPTNADYTPSVYAAFSSAGSIPVSVTASCGGTSQTAQCGELNVIAPSSSIKQYCIWGNGSGCFEIRNTYEASDCADGGGTIVSACPAATPSSSSNAMTASSSSAYVGGAGKGNNIANYKTVKIGSQTWMAENLDYYVEGSRCYKDDEANCAIYGRLYGWATAMTVCPSGWHLPSGDDWDVLMLFIHKDNGLGSFTSGTSDYAGKHLKAASGWSGNGNGLDSYGFAALPGGWGYGDGSFGSAGDSGYWWSASEYDSFDAYNRAMDYYSEGASWNRLRKPYLYSVRCVKD